ncbi:MAG: recombination mediator RecR [Pseudomonadota bacterium]
MTERIAGPEILKMIELIGKLPGLGPRSARRVALHLLKRRDTLLGPLAEALGEAAERIETCQVCGNFDTLQPCAVCRAPGRDESVLCVVADVPDLWALERAGAFRGRYHVLGGVLSAIDGIGPDELNIDKLVSRIEHGSIKEVILALEATVDGQTTAHYVADRLSDLGVEVSRLAHGVPVGGDLAQLDDGTLSTALRSRRKLGV